MSIDTKKTYKSLYLFLREEWSISKVNLFRGLITKILNDKKGEHKKEVYREIIQRMNISIISIKEIGLSQSTICAIMLYLPISKGFVNIDDIKKDFGLDVYCILKGLLKIDHIESNDPVVESENYIKLLLSLAEDIRVVFILLSQHLQLMREARRGDNQTKLNLSIQSKYLYAPLAHKLGLYNIKSELEDLSFKYTERESFDFVSRKINETQDYRNKYIANFIIPIKEKLKNTGLKYEIKGRTKSIHSINNKIKKQKIDFEDIYDLFAIRIVLDSPLELEKFHCWQVYSIITDMYQPNPKRLKDWLSVPKSNGYESLHITVMGQENRWVEVQIRTKRMDDIAERGFAAHWKYKGLKSESNLDDWLTTLRESIDNKDNLNEKLQDFKLDLYEDEIFVFSPKGDLFKLPKNSCIIDFAFSIHTKVGSTCVSGKVNGRNVPIKHILHSGDIVEVNTSSNQKPKQDWLNMVVTSRARSKIRQILKEESIKQGDIAKETLFRRMKNHKIEINESILMNLIRKMGYKTVTDFYIAISLDKLSVNNVITEYLNFAEKDKEYSQESAQNFILDKSEISNIGSTEELIIDKNLTGIDYKLAKCCNPIFGDEIFGFVSSLGIRIHRVNCPNAPELFERYGYRIIKARWSGKVSGSNHYIVTIKIIGKDHMNIVSNIMSIISKENGLSMRSINIDSQDGIFQGNISVMLGSNSILDMLIKKLSTVKGIKSVSRIS